MTQITFSPNRSSAIRALIPLICLGVGIGLGEMALIVIVPLLSALLWVRPEWRNVTMGDADTPLGRLEKTLEACQDGDLGTAVFMLDFDAVEPILPQDARAIQTTLAARMRNRMRGDDTVMANGHRGLCVILSPTKQNDLESLLQVAGRLQDCALAPVPLDHRRLHLSCDIGFCPAGNGPNNGAKQVYEAAQAALDMAKTFGPNAIRAYSKSFAPNLNTSDIRPQAVSDALQSGEIQPWFQPQMCNDTGAIIGAEALARWTTKTGRVIAPGQFLNTIDQAGLSQSLNTAIMNGALSALATWDRAKLGVKTVCVNFSSQDLHDPTLCDRVAWALDRFDMSADRLTVEILENVVSHGGKDVLHRNIDRLAEMGCPIDLDDFGTGQAPLSVLRRFPVNRLKIDRSFVRAVDKDPQQREMVAAIITLADQLHLKTIAEGVETQAELTTVAQLGSQYAQGFGIARPMPLQDATAWIDQHKQKLIHLTPLGRRA